DRIARGLAQEPVKLEVQAAGHTGGFLLAALLERGAQRLEIDVGRAPRGQEGRLGLDEPTRLDELCARDATEAEERFEVADQRPLVGFAHEVAAGRALAHLDEAAQLERAQALANRDTAGLEIASELALGRKLLALAQSPFVDLALDVSDDLLVHTRGSDSRRHGAGTVVPNGAEVKRAGVGQ